MSVSSRQDSSPSSARDYREVSWSSRRWRHRRYSQRPRLLSFDSMWRGAFPRSGVSTTDSFRCSRTSSETPSSSRRLAAGSRLAQRRTIRRSCSGWQTAAPGSRPMTCLMSLTDSGKRREVIVEAPASDFPSPRASSKLTGGTSGSRARWVGAAPSSSRSREPARQRISRTGRRRIAAEDLAAVSCQPWADSGVGPDQHTQQEHIQGEVPWSPPVLIRGVSPAGVRPAH